MIYDQAFTTIRDDALVKLTNGRPEIAYLIVGANDGTRGDPLYKHTAHPKWHGALFEPLPGPFSGLQSSYAGRPGAVLRNQAVVADAPGGKRVFHHVPASSTNSSFRRDVIERHRERLGLGTPEEATIQVEVDCVAVDELIAEPGFRVPDVLLTDTEGYDYSLFEVWWARGWRPAFVEIEVIHLAEAEKQAIRAALDEARYEIFWYESDIFALRLDQFAPSDLALYRLLRDQALGMFGLMEMLLKERRERAALNPSGPKAG